MLQDINHRFPSMFDDIAGSINRKIGIYQYIIKPNGVTVNHRLFTTIGKSILGG